MFLRINDINVNHNQLDEYSYTDGIQAVMKGFEKTPKRTKNTNCPFVKRGQLLKKLIPFETNIILSDIVIVPDLDRNKKANSHWLVASNRSSWLESFEK